MALTNTVRALVFRRLAILAMAALGANVVLAKDSVVIVTSFSKELTSAYKTGFEARFPQLAVEFINVPTTSAVSLIRDRRVGARPDVFWSSAPDAFDALARLNFLTKTGDLGDPQIPSRIGSFDVDDPNGLFKGQALSGYGIMWNTRYLQAKRLPLPKDWSDLGDPVYAGHVVMSSPSRSGTTHLIVETILQNYGWVEGWRQLVRIGANCGEITERSFGVPDAVNRGHYGLGPVIDFLGLSAKNTGFPVAFLYPRQTAVFPANIAIIEGARNPEGARAFVSFSLSQEGQAILLQPAISRFPVLPSVYAQGVAQADLSDLHEVIRDATFRFDRSISERRYRIVSSMFDQLITFRHIELKRAIEHITEAETLLAQRPHAEAAALVAQAREKAYSIPISAAQISSAAFVHELTTRDKNAGGHKKLAEAERRMAQEARDNYLEADTLAQQALHLLTTSPVGTP